MKNESNWTFLHKVTSIERLKIGFNDFFSKYLVFRFFEQKDLKLFFQVV